MLKSSQIKDQNKAMKMDDFDFEFKKDIAFGKPILSLNVLDRRVVES
jgi:hypothetical protein